MSRFEAWLLHAANLLVGGTGLVWAWMRFLVEPEDPYAVVNHPLQPDVQHLHVLTAPLLVFAVAYVWQRHIWPRVVQRQRSRRWSGLSQVLLFLPMVASGYLLQTADGEGWRRAWLVVHLSTSALWLVAAVAHLVVLRRGARRPSAAARGPAAAPARPDLHVRARAATAPQATTSPSGTRG